jgi:hypothetical protein
MRSASELSDRGRLEEIKCANQVGLKIASMDNGVEEAFLQKKLGALKAGHAHSSSSPAQMDHAQCLVALSSHFTIAISNTFSSARLPAMNRLWMQAAAIKLQSDDREMTTDS